MMRRSSSLKDMRPRFRPLKRPESKELDKDQSGDIGEEEFTHLLQQFTPEEE